MWHWVLVAPALAILAAGILFPIWGVAVSLFSLIALRWGIAHVDRLPLAAADGAAALILAALVIGAGLFAAAVAELRSTAPPTLPRPEGRPPRWRAWFARHPWWGLGLILAIAFGAVVPAYGERTSSPLLAAIVALANSGWLCCTVSWACYRLARVTVAVAWRLAVLNSPVATMLVIGAVVTTAGWAGAAQVAPVLIQALEAESQASLAHRRGPESGGLSIAANDSSGLAISGGGGLDLGGSFERCMASAEGPLRQSAANVATRYVPPDEAMEVVQEVLLNLCIRKIVPSGRPGYFIRSVQNLAIDWRRKDQRHCSIDLLPEPACELGSELNGLPSEAEITVHQAFCKLSRADQELLTLRYYEDLSHEEIGRRLGLRTDAARQRVHRAENRLKNAYLAICG